MQITLVSRPMRQDFYDQRILMPFREDSKDEYRKECNDLVAGTSGHGLGTALERYITVSVCRKSYRDAVEFFNQESFRLGNAFSELGSECKPLDAAEKLKLLAGFYRPEDAETYDFTLGDMARKGHDPRDAICPDSMEKTSDTLRIGDRWARVFYLKNYASVITDKLVSELMAAGTNVTLSMDIKSVPTDEAMREVEQKLLGVETNITNWQRRQNRNNNFSANVPYDMELQRTETTAFLDDLVRKNQKMLLCVLTMLLTADTQEQLDRETKALLSAAEGKMCQMAVLKFQQLDGLNTVLPIGPRKLECYRTLISECQAVFVPFRIVEVMDPGGIYFGENAVSHNPILINRTNLMNQAAMLFGVPGSGKSFMAKQMLAWIILPTNDRVFICDPEGEYGRLGEALCDDCVVFRLSDGGADRLNALTMVEGYAGTEQESISTKVDFILSLLELLDNCETGPQEKSLIDRCLKLVFAEQKRTGIEPTLRDLREKLLEQPEPEARAIALSMDDPKGELLRDTGALLEAEGYEIKVIDLINMEKSHCYNPFVYLRDDNDIQRLVTNLFKNTTPKGSQTQDPFWDQAATMLLLALIFYLHYEAPPDEQNFSMVMYMIRCGSVKEDNDKYMSPLDILFQRLELRDPEHIALKYYKSYHSGSGKTLKSIQITLISRLEKFNLGTKGNANRFSATVGV